MENQHIKRTRDEIARDHKDLRKYFAYKRVTAKRTDNMQYADFWNTEKVNGKSFMIYEISNKIMPYKSIIQMLTRGKHATMLSVPESFFGPKRAYLLIHQDDVDPQIGFMDDVYAISPMVPNLIQLKNTVIHA